jgi:hypothetical protein
MPTVLAPPPRYDHPYRDGPVIERVLPLEEVRKLCISGLARPTVAAVT